MTLFFKPETFGEVSPFVDSLKKSITHYLPASSSGLHILLDSTAVAIVTKVSLKKLPLIELLQGQGKLKVTHYFSFFSADFLEAGWVCLACGIHNFVLALGYTVAAGATLGFSQNLNFACKKHWLHTKYSTKLLGISMIGSFLPVAGGVLTLKFLESSVQDLRNGWQTDRQKFEAPLIAEIKSIYARNKSHIAHFLQANFNLDTYATDIYHLQSNFDAKINTVANLDELGALLKTIYREFKAGPTKKVICTNCHQSIRVEDKKEVKELVPPKSNFMSWLLSRTS
ncbi:MAG TPA: hypothetical protein VLG76_07700 [Rhabdochlamydiaceae bacterium]|nr:hypothetical protein [Rhabdochlamydiaceae bacterium]